MRPDRHRPARHWGEFMDRRSHRLSRSRSRRGSRLASALLLGALVAVAAAALGWTVGAAVANGSPAPSPSPIASATGGWQPQSSEVDADLGLVDFVDPAHGWAAGAAGTVVATTDGGASWQAQASGVGSGMAGLAFADAMHGWLTGGGVVLATTDGGASWSAQQPGIAGWLGRIAVTDPDHVWILGPQPGIVASADGGTVWVPQSSNSTEYLLDLSFADNGHGWATGFWGTIVATTDGGVAWTPQISGVADATLMSADSVDASHGWAAGFTGGGYGAHACLLATTDGGSTWTQSYRGTAGSVIADVSFVDAEHGWCLIDYLDGVFNGIYVTDDGGATWRLQAVTKNALTALKAVDADHAWAVGPGGAVLATADGGDSLDVTAPHTTAGGADNRWHRHGVKVFFAATDDGGSGSVYSEWRLDAQKRWQRGRAYVYARPSHASDGIHTVWYRSVDAAGNVEAARSVKVKIDTRPPTIVGRTASLTVARGGLVTVTNKVTDKSPCGVWARNVQLTLTGEHDGSEFRAQTVRCGNQRVGVWRTVSFRCWLPRGGYLMTMTACDAAGNTGSGFFGMLTVR